MVDEIAGLGALADRCRCGDEEFQDRDHGEGTESACQGVCAREGMGHVQGYRFKLEIAFAVSPRKESTARNECSFGRFRWCDDAYTQRRGREEGREITGCDFFRERFDPGIRFRDDFLKGGSISHP
jgi:hypothetical protein